MITFDQKKKKEKAQLALLMTNLCKFWAKKQRQLSAQGFTTDP